MWALRGQSFCYAIPSRNFISCLQVRSIVITQARVKMSSDRGDQSQDLVSDPEISKVTRLLKDNPSDGWERCWAQNLTPWDLGQPTPVILHLLQTGALPKGRALVPGCGTGYDVVAMASPERNVIGLDISDAALKKAKEISSSSPNVGYFTFLKEDFFTWKPKVLFDLIFDYTFFCAIEPCLRRSWACCVNSLLKPDGELITLIFPISEHQGGPPFKVSLADYEEVLHPLGFEAISVIDNELAVEPRKGREKLGRWRRSLKQSHNISGSFH